MLFLWMKIHRNYLLMKICKRLECFEIEPLANPGSASLVESAWSVDGFYILIGSTFPVPGFLLDLAFLCWCQIFPFLNLNLFLPDLVLCWYRLALTSYDLLVSDLAPFFALPAWCWFEDFLPFAACFAQFWFCGLCNLISSCVLLLFILLYDQYS